MTDRQILNNILIIWKKIIKKSALQKLEIPIEISTGICHKRERQDTNHIKKVSKYASIR